jgi:ribosome-binding protein aMBF1 (putative translation factor)
MAEGLSLGTRIRRARERLNMSQAQLAAAVHRSRSAVNSWEQDRVIPRNSIGALEAVLAIDLSSDAGADPREAEIRELAERLGLPPQDQEAWISTYRKRLAEGDVGQQEMTG